jgi:hypothetical protein
LDPCPDSVWELLPGGRDVADEADAEIWQYRGTWVLDDHVLHQFRHDRHPLFDGAVVSATVADSDAGPRLFGVLSDRDGLVMFDDLAVP